MNTRLVVSLLFAGALAFACGPRSRTAAAPMTSSSSLRGDAFTQARGDDPATSQRATTGTNDQALTTQFNVAATHGRVDFAMDLTNASKKRLEVEFLDGQAYDVVVVDSVGREVWRWANGHIFTQSVQNTLLGRGESMHLSERWTSPKPGKYVAIMTLRSTNFPVERRAEFETR